MLYIEIPSSEIIGLTFGSEELNEANIEKELLLFFKNTRCPKPSSNSILSGVGEPNLPGNV
jgi:hypothetical protein